MHFHLSLLDRADQRLVQVDGRKALAQLLDLFPPVGQRLEASHACRRPDGERYLCEVAAEGADVEDQAGRKSVLRHPLKSRGDVWHAETSGERIADARANFRNHAFPMPMLSGSPRKYR